jgi:hypothetical protein
MYCSNNDTRVSQQPVWRQKHETTPPLKTKILGILIRLGNSVINGPPSTRAWSKTHHVYSLSGAAFHR